MPQLQGRWDLVVGKGEDRYPSWLEIGENGGRFVGRFGSARPIAKISATDSYVSFSLPKQYESRTTDLVFEGELVEGKLVGTTTTDSGEETVWTGTPAPDLPFRDVEWAEPLELIGENLETWRPRSKDFTSHWSIVDGQLVNAAVGSDLVTINAFGDFKLIAEYKYPVGSNSGIYLRGRYEFQIVDDHSTGLSGVGNSGAIYGFLAPTVNAIRSAGEWNTAEITLVGRFITVVLNGVTVIDNQEIPGITGGALDSSEGDPGPIFVQGDHGPVTFRRLTLYPAK